MLHDVSLQHQDDGADFCSAPTARSTQHTWSRQGEVPLSDGSGPRQDASSIVVLDGLMEDDERAALLSWLTADGWDGSGDAPPEDKWAQNCVDHVDGEAGRSLATWGLQEHVVQARSLCSRCRTVFISFFSSSVKNKNKNP